MFTQPLYFTELLKFKFIKPVRYARIALPLFKWMAAAVGHPRVTIQEEN